MKVFVKEFVRKEQLDVAAYVIRKHQTLAEACISEGFEMLEEADGLQIGR